MIVYVAYRALIRESDECFPAVVWLQTADIPLV
jgi:hypothetical protein